MSREPHAPEAPSGYGGCCTPARLRSLPDVNAETYPYDLVQRLLDQTADFILFAVPDPKYAETATLTPDDPNDFFGINGGYGLDLGSAFHRFESLVQLPTLDGGVKVTQAVGEPIGTLRCRWLFGPDDLEWRPGREPPSALFDPWRSQAFAMLEDCFRFVGSKDGFRGSGVGRTFPVTVGGQPQTLAGAVGNLGEGYGKFKGLEGTYVLTGTITPALGFLGIITCRVVDPQGKLRGGREIPPLKPVADPCPGATFFVLRGQKEDATVKTTYGTPPAGDLISLITPSQIRAVRSSFTNRGAGGLRSARRVGQVIGAMDATVFFDLLAPPGTASAPVPFTTQELYTFLDSEGRAVGTITAGVEVGESFDLRFAAAPGQPGVRFAGFGQIQGGTGPFTDVQGMLTVNSLIGISPHALSLLHVLHVIDPEGKCRAAWREDRY
jgi:hypothetical protein